MTANEQIYSKIQLLNNYALCLQQQNQSKNKQINTLHNHLELINKQNQTLRNNLQLLQQQIASNSEAKNSLVDLSLQASIVTSEIGSQIEFQSVQCQTQEIHQELNASINQEIINLQQQIAQKDDKIYHFQQECEEMYDGIETLEKQLSDKQVQNQQNLERIIALQAQLQQQFNKKNIFESKYKQLQKSLNHTNSINTYKQQYQNIQIQLQSLVCQNNRLIERVRDLQKEKNGYYHEVKRLSRISFGQEQQQLGNSTFKKHNKVKDSRWKQIQTNLKKLQMQNMLIKSNLQIPR